MDVWLSDSREGLYTFTLVIYHGAQIMKYGCRRKQIILFYIMFS